jgi:hypothetical protein
MSTDSRSHIPSALPSRELIARYTTLIRMYLDEKPRRGESEAMFERRIACDIARLGLRIRDETLVMCGASRGSWRTDPEVVRFLQHISTAPAALPPSPPPAVPPPAIAPSPNTISQGRHP